MEWASLLEITLTPKPSAFLRFTSDVFVFEARSLTASPPQQTAMAPSQREMSERKLLYLSTWCQLLLVSNIRRGVASNHRGRSAGWPGAAFPPWHPHKLPLISTWKIFALRLSASWSTHTLSLLTSHLLTKLTSISSLLHCLVLLLTDVPNTSDIFKTAMCPKCRHMLRGCAMIW